MAIVVLTIGCGYGVGGTFGVGGAGELDGDGVDFAGSGGARGEGGRWEMMEVATSTTPMWPEDTS